MSGIAYRVSTREEEGGQKRQKTAYVLCTRSLKNLEIKLEINKNLENKLENYSYFKLENKLEIFEVFCQWLMNSILGQDHGLDLAQ